MGRKHTQSIRNADNSSAAYGILKLQRSPDLIYESRIEAYIEKWDNVRKILGDSKSSREILELLQSVGLRLDDFKKIYIDEKIHDGIEYAKHLRD